MKNNTKTLSNGTTWNFLAKSFHWLVAILIVTATILGIISDELTLSPVKLQLFVTHKSVGITVLCLMLLRLLWRLLSSAPKALVGLSATNQRLANLGHVSLYALAILLPLSGWLLTSAANFPFRWFDFFEMPLIWTEDKTVQDLASTAHYLLFIVLAVMVLGHVAMVVKHEFQGLAIVRRMWSGKRRVLLPLIIIVVTGLVAWAWFDARSHQKQPSMNAEQLVLVEDAANSITALDNLVIKPEDVWQMVAEKSALGFIATYAGVEFEGGFSRFSPTISFAPDNLSGSIFDVTIDITTVQTGSADRDEMLPGAEWFAFAQYPASRYWAAEFVKTAAGFQALGILQLKGVEQPVVLDFQWILQGDGQVQLKGSAVVSRTVFGIGSGDWAEDSTVGFDVTVVVDLLLEKPGY